MGEALRLTRVIILSMYIIKVVVSAHVMGGYFINTELISQGFSGEQDITPFQVASDWSTIKDQMTMLITSCSSSS